MKKRRRKVSTTTTESGTSLFDSFQKKVSVENVAFSINAQFQVFF